MLTVVACSFYVVCEIIDMLAGARRLLMFSGIYYVKACIASWRSFYGRYGMLSTMLFMEN